MQQNKSMNNRSQDPKNLNGIAIAKQLAGVISELEYVLKNKMMLSRLDQEQQQNKYQEAKNSLAKLIGAAIIDTEFRLAIQS